MTPPTDTLDTLRAELRRRCEAAQCYVLDEPYREKLKRLHADMLDHIDALERDARRYRWLRDDQNETPLGQRELYVVQERTPHSDERDEYLWGADLDAAIDAALAEQGEPK